MTTALYRRYRSERFADLVGQDQIARTLRNQVRSGQLAHAYLFTGIRGTGKTSTARILARAINCLDPKDGEPCNACAACVEISGGGAVDVLEIDAASNRGIDEMRDLREKVNYLPASLTRKVYIIDEAHMLTGAAWNAFLKTLEEPPAHVVFVLATTEPHEVPETIRSRVQRFDFRRVTTDDLVTHLGSIATSEAVEVEAEAIALFAAAGQGSVRDALSLLDQALASGERPLTIATARRALGLADPATLRDLVVAIAERDAGAALRGAATAFESGADPRQLVRELARWARALSLCAVGYADGADLIGEDRVLGERLAGEAGADLWIAALERLNATERDLRQPVDARLQVEHCLLRLARPAALPGAGSSVDGAALAALEARIAKLETRPAPRASSDASATSSQSRTDHHRASAADAPLSGLPHPTAPPVDDINAATDLVSDVLARASAPQPVTPAAPPAVAPTPAPVVAPVAAETVASAPLAPAVAKTAAVAPTAPSVPIADPTPVMPEAVPTTGGAETGVEDGSANAPSIGDSVATERWTAQWTQLVEAADRRDSMVAGVLRDCRVLEATDAGLVIGAPYTFHLDRLNDPVKLPVLAEAATEIAGKPQTVEVRFCGDAKPASAKPSGSQSDVTRAALETFKGSRITASRLRDDH